MRLLKNLFTPLLGILLAATFIAVVLDALIHLGVVGSADRYQKMAKTNVVIQYGEPLPPASAFLESGAPEATMTTRANTGKPGVYPVVLHINGNLAMSYLCVTDTTPPYAEPRHVNAWQYDTFEPLDFYVGLSDVSPVTAEFERVPDWSAIGEIEVAVVLTDGYGNRSVVVSGAFLREDTQPPEIIGAVNLKALLGEPCAFGEGVTAEDEKDGAVELRIDSSAADFDNAGEYPIVYSASDGMGNVNSVTVTLTVGSLNEAYVNDMADATLAEILTPDMTGREKAKAIHDWVRHTVRYTPTGAKDDVVSGAYNAYKLRSGDCYTYYAVSEVLLTRAGIENMCVTRVGGNTQHFWNLIYLDDGWYHYDATPYSKYFDGSMFTESQARKYTHARGNHYYDYDASLYPEVVFE
jgi:hypothetical protein